MNIFIIVDTAIKAHTYSANVLTMPIPRKMSEKYVCSLVFKCFLLCFDDFYHNLGIAFSEAAMQGRVLII